MDTIKIRTADDREITFVGYNFQRMLHLIKSINGARFVGTVREYGEQHQYNHWEVPYVLKDVEMAYGPFAALRAIAVMQFEGETSPSKEIVNELLQAHPDLWGLALQEAYRAGRDGEDEPDYRLIASEATSQGHSGNADQLEQHMRSLYQEGRHAG
jgi:hypothetical protein